MTLRTEITEHLAAKVYGSSCKAIADSLRTPYSDVRSELARMYKAGEVLAPRGWCAGSHGDLRQTIVLAGLWPSMAK